MSDSTDMLLEIAMLNERMDQIQSHIKIERERMDRKRKIMRRLVRFLDDFKESGKCLENVYEVYDCAEEIYGILDD